MKIKRLKKIQINSYKFKVIWDKNSGAGGFDYGERIIKIGTNSNDDLEIFQILCHELMEIIMCELHVRHSRTDCDSDYIFVYDHRQHDLAMNMFSGLISQFIK